MRPRRRVVRAPRFAVVGVAVPGWYPSAPLELLQPAACISPEAEGELDRSSDDVRDPRPLSSRCRACLPGDMAACERAGGGATGDPRRWPGVVGHHVEGREGISAASI